MIAWIVRHFVFASRPVVIEGLATTQKRKVYYVKKRKWNDNYTAYRFYRTKEEALNPYPSARCLFAQLSLEIVT